MGDQGAVALANSLKTNACLTTLDLVSEGSREGGGGHCGVAVRLLFVLGCVVPLAM